MLGKDFDFEDAEFEEEGMSRVVKFLVDRGLILKPVEEPLGERVSGDHRWHVVAGV